MIRKGSFCRKIEILWLEQSKGFLQILCKFSQVSYLVRHVRCILNFCSTKLDRVDRTSFVIMHTWRNLCFLLILNHFGNSNWGISRSFFGESLEIFCFGSFANLPWDCFDLDRTQILARRRWSGAKTRDEHPAASIRPAIIFLLRKVRSQPRFAFDLFVNIGIICKTKTRPRSQTGQLPLLRFIRSWPKKLWEKDYHSWALADRGKLFWVGEYVQQYTGTSFLCPKDITSSRRIDA